MITPEMRHCAPYEVVSLQVTGTNWTSYRAIGHAYKTINGTWRLVFNIEGNFSVGVTSGYIAIAGVVFKNATSHYQNVSCQANNAFGARAVAYLGTSQMELACSASSTDFRFGGDIELDRKPDWIMEN